MNLITEILHYRKKRYHGKTVWELVTKQGVWRTNPEIGQLIKDNMTWTYRPVELVIEDDQIVKISAVDIVDHEDDWLEAAYEDRFTVEGDY